MLHGSFLESFLESWWKRLPRGRCAAAAAAFALLGSSVAGAATLLTDGGGQLIGASGVDVAGTLYDVEFADGSCISLFSGCDEASDFTFQAEADASAASQALLDQVLIDGPSGSFDTFPDLVSGCGPVDECYLMTPYGLSGSDGLARWALNASPASDYLD